MSLAAVIWPARFVPGTTDHFVSNEMIVSGLTAFQAWRFLVTPSLWRLYHLPGRTGQDVTVTLRKGLGAQLRYGARFSFFKPGLKLGSTSDDLSGVTSANEVVEYAPPSVEDPARVGRIAWGCSVGEKLETHHAWVLQNLEGGRLRLLTQEVQRGALARAVAETSPDSSLVAHQAWLSGLVKEALKRRP